MYSMLLSCFKESRYIIEDGMKNVSQRPIVHSKFTKLFFRVTFFCFIMVIIFGYSFVVSRQAKIFGNLDDFDQHFVNRSTVSGIFQNSFFFCLATYCLFDKEI